MICEVCEIEGHEYGTQEHQRIFSLKMGWPYGAELTYKHAYWRDDNYKFKWDQWRLAGGKDKEPDPPSGPDYR